MSADRTGEEHDEESFFVSMTDIMVGLLFIFILIIMYFAIQAKLDMQRIGELDDKVEIMTKLIRKEGDKKRIAEIEAYQEQVTAQRKNILNWIRAQLQANGVDGVEVIEEQGVLRLPEGILFGSGEFRFEPESKALATAQALAMALDEVLPCSVLDSEGLPLLPEELCDQAFYHNKNNAYVQAIYIEGHTDNVQITGRLKDPNLTTNLKLSARRATNTFEIIRDTAPRVLFFHGPSLGQDSFRVEPVLASAAYGEARPAVSNATTEGRATNRRIDLRVVMYVPTNHDSMIRFSDQIGAKVTSVLD